MSTQDKYIELDVKVSPEYSDILISELSEIGYDMFMESDSGFVTYSTDAAFDRESFEAVLGKYAHATEVRYETKVQDKVNWNETWEENFEPVFIGNRCIIRAHFHKPEKQFPLEIIITPKMSFGTGHHHTTRMMIELLLDTNVKDKRVMDAGTGTGILAVAAAKLGAFHVLAFDTDDWCIQNSTENVSINKVKTVEIVKGTIRESGYEPMSYDLVMANINRNILLEELDEYLEALLPIGQLMLSGFLQSDVAAILDAAGSRGFKMNTIKTSDNWAAILLDKYEK